MLEHYEKGWKDSDVIAQVQKERGITKTQAVKWLRERIPPERYYQKKIIEALRREYPDAYVVKVSQGAYSIGGIPDIMCVVGGRYFERFPACRSWLSGRLILPEARRRL